MKKEIENDNEEPSAPFWMVTYGDMVTLLLTFFILLISFSNLDEVKFEKAAHSLKGALGVLDSYESQQVSNVSSDSFSEVDLLRRSEIYESVTELEKIAKDMGFEEDISIQINENGLLIRLGDRVLFDLGKAYLKPEAFPVLDIVGKTIKIEAKEVIVGGHTDNVPIKTGKFPSNWELSTARALSVVKYLTEKPGVSPEVLAATGYSEFRPVETNESQEGRGKNRRVEFLITWK
ncbi:MAG: flagellar motor protein MotB [Candidatus Hatepunaea meridiana]|nr:flagellar motor protein MotB [Candidatus Hatepunaea meridiana]